MKIWSTKQIHIQVKIVAVHYNFILYIGTGVLFRTMHHVQHITIQQHGTHDYIKCKYMTV